MNFRKLLAATAAAALALSAAGAEAGDHRHDRDHGHDRGYRHDRDHAHDRGHRHDRRLKVELLTSGLLGSIGGTIGPDGALYVPQGATGEIIRVDTKSGLTSTFAAGLPPQPSVAPIGGPFDLAFAGHTAYVLVSLVGPEDFGPFSTGANGIYRIDGPGTPTLIADLGAFSLANPPTEPFLYFLQGGVQYAMEKVRDGFLVTDGHHNRVLHVGFDGAISVVKQYGNIVPAGLSVFRGKVLLAETGSITGTEGDYREIGRITRFDLDDPSDGRILAEGISMAVDVQVGPGKSLYALSQGDWNPQLGPEAAGGPALPNTGRLLRLERGGSTTELLGEINLPTSLHFADDTAYIVTLTGDVWKLRGIGEGGRGRGRGCR